MTRLELTPEEAAMLHEILTSYLGDLRFEISSTDTLFFREGLKQKEVFIKDLLQRLAPAAGEGG